MYFLGINFSNFLFPHFLILQLIYRLGANAFVMIIDKLLK